MRNAHRRIAPMTLVILLATIGCGSPLFWSSEAESVRSPAIILESEVPMKNGTAVAKTEITSASDAVKAMGVGWNLGNTLDSIDNQKWGISKEINWATPERYYETSWGNPITTAEMIDAVARAGFKAVRIPVTYADHMDKDFQIRAQWLERVGQVVDYVLDNDMYCIINLHHDTGYGTWPWLKADPDNIGQLEEQLRTVWMQIARYFEGYGNRLLFESFNEILDTQDRWSGPDVASYSAVNKLNQVFVDTVRSVGPNNANRFLVVKTYAAGAGQEAIDAFILPKDSVADRLIVGVHNYGEAAFAWQQSQVSWAEAYSDWTPLRDGRPVEEMMKRLNASFVEKGTPVIIGEFGAQNKGNADARASYATHYVKAAKQYGIACFWWDTGGQFEEAEAVNGYALLDRVRVKWFFPEIVEALVAAGK